MARPSHLQYKVLLISHLRFRPRPGDLSNARSASPTYLLNNPSRPVSREHGPVARGLATADLLSMARRWYSSCVSPCSLSLYLRVQSLWEEATEAPRLIYRKCEGIIK